MRQHLKNSVPSIEEEKLAIKLLVSINMPDVMTASNMISLSMDTTRPPVIDSVWIHLLKSLNNKMIITKGLWQMVVNDEKGRACLVHVKKKTSSQLLCFYDYAYRALIPPIVTMENEWLLFWTCSKIPNFTHLDLAEACVLLSFMIFQALLTLHLYVLFFKFHGLTSWL